MSDEEIIQRARKIGMVMSDSERESEEEALSQEDTQAEDGQAEEGQTDDGQQEGTSEGEGRQTGEQSVTITVSQGEVCRQIAEDLAGNGLVDDAEEFRKFMYQNGYDSLILEGDFTIPYGASYEEIATILTTKIE